MRTRKEIAAALAKWYEKQLELKELGDTLEISIRTLAAQGIIEALSWVLGKDNMAFGPVREKGTQAKRGRKSLGIPVGRLVQDRLKGRSLKRLAKDYRCSKSTVVLYLKQGRNSLTPEEREDYDRRVREQSSRKVKGKI